MVTNHIAFLIKINSSGSKIIGENEKEKHYEI